MTQDVLTFDVYRPQPLIIVISGTSGVGKDAVIRELRRLDIPLHVVVTATSRPIRECEVEGIDYFFYSENDFLSSRDAGEFVEWAKVYDDYKGIPRSQVEHAMASGKDVVIKVDVQGAETLRKIYPEAVLIMIIPTSEPEWRQRLLNRKTETAAQLKTRTETAIQEMTKIDLFDYVVVNAENLQEKAAEDICSIIKAEHHRVKHRKIQ